MKRVPYMRDPHSRRVWLDRCPDCRGVWFDVGELEETSGRDLQLVLLAAERETPCPRCAQPLREATVLKAAAFGCSRCRGLHLPRSSMRALQVNLDGEEPTLRPPPLFECCICQRTFSLDQGDGVTCRACAPAGSLGRGDPYRPLATPDDALNDQVGFGGLLDFLFTR
jgi:Zn-finger nucleic acid-binding protein